MKDKTVFCFDTLLLAHRNPAVLACIRRISDELQLAKNTIEFTTGEDAYKHLFFSKHMSDIKNRTYPDLIIMDHTLPYTADRKLPDDIFLLYPLKESRPLVIVLWEAELPVKHAVVSSYMEMPLNREKLVEALRKTEGSNQRFGMLRINFAI